MSTQRDYSQELWESGILKEEPRKGSIFMSIDVANTPTPPPSQELTERQIWLAVGWLTPGAPMYYGAFPTEALAYACVQREKAAAPEIKAWQTIIVDFYEATK